MRSPSVISKVPNYRLFSLTTEITVFVRILINLNLFYNSKLTLIHSFIDGTLSGIDIR